MRNDPHMTGTPVTYNVVIITLDAHSMGPAQQAAEALVGDYPGLCIDIHAAAQWGSDPQSFERTKAAIATGDIIITNLLFLEDHVRPLVPLLQARRDSCDAMIGVICDASLVKLTKMGALDMGSPQSSTMSLLKRLRGSSKPGVESGAKKMRMLRRLPKILKFIPGKAQDLRAWFLVMQYWMGGTDENIAAMLRFLLSRYCRMPQWQNRAAPEPKMYPELGLYHPDVPDRITEDLGDLPRLSQPVATVGLLLMRSYVLSGDTAHYDAVIAAYTARNIQVIPAFASGLDNRPAIETFFKSEEGAQIDALVSLTGFSLVGGPAYNDAAAAVETLKSLDVPYATALPLEFQTLSQWAASTQGLGPIENTMLVALPELDGATLPTVFAGRHGHETCQGCARQCHGGQSQAMAPCYERIETLVARTAKLAILRRAARAQRRVGVVLFGFPPNAGATGTAAYLNVFASLWNTLNALKDQGYHVDLPETPEALREAVLVGNSAQYGQEANVAASISAETIVNTCPWLGDIEAQWGPAPGRHQSNGKEVFVLGRQFGNVFVGIQPAFGYEGDPMRLLFEGGFCPTHAFVNFYEWLKHEYKADALLHFGMHGALEFMPGKQAGLSGQDWPDRLIGDLPNIYLYAGNNPSEASLAKRRSGATIITHVTPPLVAAGLYKGLAELKDSLTQWRQMPQDDTRRADLEALIWDQANLIDLSADDITQLWPKLMDLEQTLIPDGLHIIGQDKSEQQIRSYQEASADQTPEGQEHIRTSLSAAHEINGLLDALDGRFIRPVVGGDLTRSTDILPAGRNIHAFDPFRMPSAFACRLGQEQANLLLSTHNAIPKTIALVLWGSDNIKSDGSPIAQALALMGARPRFDSFGRLSGADLIDLAELGRPRIDVIMTLSGIFRDLLPLQTKMLAEAALKAACADEPLDQNYIRAHALDYAATMNVSLEQAALRVFSNAEGAYGSNVNQLVDSSAFGDDDELADAYQARKSFAYGVDGKAQQNSELLAKALGDVELMYQNLESVELGVTTVDHYFDTLGGIARAVKRAKGGEDAAIYISDHTRGTGKVRSLSDQLELETRTRSLNPKFYEALLDHGAEGVRQLEAHVTNTMGWSATTKQVEPWVYQQISETFVLDDAMRKRLADLNPVASARMANRLIEATDRAYWTPDAATLDALQRAADDLEDTVEGVAAQ